MPGLRLLAILQTDCPTCRLITPYLNKLAGNAGPVTAISQDAEDATREFVRQMEVRFPVERDPGFEISKRLGVVTVPTLYVLDEHGRVVRQEPGFDKSALNEIAAMLGHEPVATPLRRRAREQARAARRGIWKCRPKTPPPRRSTCIRRAALRRQRIELAGRRRSLRVLLPHVQRCAAGGAADARARRARCCAPLPDTTPREIIARIPPCYGEATVEKIAANAVMAGCVPEMMRVLIPLVRAVCDERFNAHGVQATTHFAAPLIIVNGPVRSELSFTRARTSSATWRAPTARSAARCS